MALLVDPLAARTRGSGHARGLASALSDRGHRVLTYGLPGGARSSPEAGSGSSRIAGPETIAAEAPEVVLAYDAHSPAAWVGAKVARRCGIPLAIVEPGGVTRSGILERTLQRVGGGLFGATVRRAAAWVFCPDEWASHLALEAGFEPEKVETLWGGVDVQRFRPDANGSLLSRHRIRGRVLLHAGRLGNSEGSSVLMAAFARTIGRRVDWSLVLCGDGHSSPRLRAQRERLGISANVFLLPTPEEKEWPGLFAAAEIFAAPSVDEGVRGGTLLRAMASARPVLASNLQRTVGLVEPDGNGTLLAPGDLDAWTEGIERLSRDPVRRERMGARGRELCKSVFGWRPVAQRVEGRLFDLVDGMKSAADPERATAG